MEGSWGAEVLARHPARVCDVPDGSVITDVLLLERCTFCEPRSAAQGAWAVLEAVYLEWFLLVKELAQTTRWDLLPKPTNPESWCAEDTCAGRCYQNGSSVERARERQIVCVVSLFFDGVVREIVIRFTFVFVSVCSALGFGFYCSSCPARSARSAKVRHAGRADQVPLRLQRIHCPRRHHAIHGAHARRLQIHLLPRF